MFLQRSEDAVVEVLADLRQLGLQVFLRSIADLAGRLLRFGAETADQLVDCIRRAEIDERHTGGAVLDFRIFSERGEHERHVSRRMRFLHPHGADAHDFDERGAGRQLVAYLVGAGVVILGQLGRRHSVDAAFETVGLSLPLGQLLLLCVRGGGRGASAAFASCCRSQRQRRTLASRSLSPSRSRCAPRNRHRVSRRIPLRRSAQPNVSTIGPLSAAPGGVIATMMSRLSPSPASAVLHCASVLKLKTDCSICCSSCMAVFWVSGAMMFLSMMRWRRAAHRGIRCA